MGSLLTNSGEILQWQTLHVANLKADKRKLTNVFPFPIYKSLFAGRLSTMGATNCRTLRGGPVVPPATPGRGGSMDDCVKY